MRHTALPATFGVAVLLSASVLLGPQAGAQSTISLPPSIDLNEAEPPTSGTNGSPTRRLQGCTTGSGPDCVGSDSAVGFSLADVVNLGIIDREEAATLAPAGGTTPTAGTPQALPSIDLEVLFDYNSDRLRDDQLQQLRRLADDLRGVDLQQGYLIVMGHTDAVGSMAYNDDLSLRRARSVAEFLRHQAGLPAQRIRTSGQAFRYLRYPDQPTHAANRRVQVILAGQGG